MALTLGREALTNLIEDDLATRNTNAGLIETAVDGCLTEIIDESVTNTKLAHMAAATIKGRKTASTGDPEDLSKTEALALLNVADGANNYIHPSGDGNLHVPANGTSNNNKVLTSSGIAGEYSWETPSGDGYVHPNHSGDVTSVGDGAQTITNKAVTLTKMADMATASILGRKTAGTGIPEVLSKSDVLTLLNVADGANAGLTDVVDDTTPQLGGELDCNGHTIGNAEYDNSNSGTSKTIDWRKGNHQKVTMNGNCTFTFTAPTKACHLQLRFINDTTAGRTITLPTMKWQGGTTPTWTKLANAIDILNIYYDGSAYYGMASLAWS